MHRHINYEPHFCVELCCGFLYERYNLMVDVEENTKFNCVNNIFSDTVSIFVKHLQIGNNPIMVNRIGQNRERNSQSRGHSPYKKSKP